MKIGFIGCGNMGSALASAVCKKKTTKVYISDPNAEKTSAFSKATGAEISSNTEIAEGCDFIFLAIKPNMFETVLSPIADAFSKNKSSVVVTMAAGLKIEKLEGIIGKEHKIVRIMPNTPCAVGAGMILYCANKNVSNSEKASFTDILSGAGRLDEVPENLIDAGSAVSGSGPAFVYMFIEALADGGVKCGLPRDKALLYAIETVKGSAKIALETGKHPGVLKDEVCSPGGSTIEGVRALEDGAFRGTAIDAVVATFEKAKTLGK